MTQPLSLSGVPETMLWTLHNRAAEAMRADGIIRDEKAIEIYRAIGGDGEGLFGKAEPSHAVRSLDFDNAVEAFLRQHPDGTVVNLGEGLETQRFRIQAKDALWISVDLPEAMAVRERFIRPDARHIHVAASATDNLWLESVPKDRPVFITAQGLMMYFDEQDVKVLIQNIAATFAQAHLMFDTIPRWLSEKTRSSEGLMRGAEYRAPAMPWGINGNRIRPTLENWLSRETNITVSQFSAFPRGMMKWLYPFFCRAPMLKHRMPSIVRLDFL